MAIPIHVVRVALTPVSSVGSVLDKNTATIKQMMTADTDHRVIEDASIPNSTGRPTVKDYLILEAADDFRLQYMDQNTVVTYG